MAMGYHLQASRPSLLKLFIGAVVLSVTVVLSGKAVYEYYYQRHIVVERIHTDAYKSLGRLSETIEPFMKAFAINDYEQLVRKELESTGYSAIVVSNYAFGELTGQSSYLSGFVRTSKNQLESFKPDSENQQKLIDQAFFYSTELVSSTSDDAIGQVSVYISSDEIDQQLSQVLVNNLISSAVMLILLIGLVIYITISFLIRPLKRMSGVLAVQDDHGIPTTAVPVYQYRELSLLSDTINNMIGVVRESRNSLEKERDQYQRVIEGTRAGTWEWNVETGQTICNERWAEMVGYSLDELMPTSIDTWKTLCHPEDQKKSLELLERHFAGELPNYECEARMRHKNGQWIWVVDRGRVSYWTEEGKPLWVSGTHQEISLRKQSEEALANSESRYRHLSELSPSALWQCDSHGKLTFVSQRWTEITGISFADACQQGWLGSIHQDDQKRVISEWRRVLSQANSFRSEYRIQKSDGSVVWVLCLANVVTDDQHNSTGWIGTISDITELKRTEEKLHDATLKAEAANIAKSRFLATMSHEIRTPMNGILGMAQLLESQDLVVEKQQQYARTIMHSGQTLLSLLNDILDISKVEAGKISLESGAVELTAVLAEVSKLFNEMAVNKGLQLRVKVDPDSHLSYIGDPLRVRQMLSNLVNNAIKFTAAGDVDITVKEIQQRDDHSIVEFSVSDTGIGVPEAKIGMLFEPFVQTDDSTTRKYGGSGLGLSIVRSLSRLMNGDAGVENRAEGGARFWFQVCMQRRHWDVSEGAEYCDIDQVQNNPSADVLTGRVLVVEDDKTNRMVAQAILSRMGVDVALAENGQKAVEMIIKEGQKFDVILMDLNMPIMDGYTATETIRRWETNTSQAAIPIVALTADAFPEDKCRCEKAGMDAFLTKPILADTLKQTLQQWL